MLLESEEKDTLIVSTNVKRLHMMRFFLVKAAPVLTLDIKLGNLCNPEHPDDFLYNDLNEVMGKNINEH